MSKTTTKYYLTIDVGVKNLAYCLSKYDYNKNICDGMNILDWNLLDASYKPLICKHIKNKRKICNSKSIFYCLKNNILNKKISHKNRDNLIGYCQHHATELRQTNKSLYSTLYRVSKNQIFSNEFGDKIDRLLTVLENFYNKKIASPYDIGEFENFVNNKQHLINNLEIYIENQPVYKHPFMKTVSNTIFTFFALKKVIYPNIIKSVNFISPKEKTQITFIKSLNNLMNLNFNYNTNFKIYLERKKFAIEASNKIIPKLNKSIFNIISSINFDLSTKQDDLGDTLLYVFVNIFKNIK